jgi:hypothetical protein
MLVATAAQVTLCVIKGKFSLFRMYVAIVYANTKTSVTVPLRDEKFVVVIVTSIAVPSVT